MIDIVYRYNREGDTMTVKEFVRRVQIAADPIASLYFWVTLPCIVFFFYIITALIAGDLCNSTEIQ